MNYNIIAPYYDILSRIAFCNRQQRAHRLILKYIQPHQHILWLGGGSGWFLKEIDQLGYAVTIDYIEFSESMMNQAKQIPLKNLNLNFIHEDAFEYKYVKKYDVIITAFFFDHFTEEKCTSLHQTLDFHLVEGGLWFYVDFIQNQNKIQKFITQLMIYFFRLVAQIKTDNFPKVEYLFKAYKLVEEKMYFGNYITSRIYRK